MARGGQAVGRGLIAALDAGTLVFAAALLLLGAVGGLLAGLLGVGGGMILVPFTSLLFASRGIAAELALKMALATSLATILFTALSSVRAHAQHGAVRTDIVWRLAPGILLGALAGAQVARWLPATALQVVFALFLAAAATQMLRGRQPVAARALPGTAGMGAMGLLIGTVSALVGAGGAFLSVPFMAWCGVAIHQAVGTASAIGLPIALAGSAGFMIAGLDVAGLPPGALGYVYLPALAALALASVATAPLGAALAHRTDVRRLKRIFATMLYGVGLMLLWRALRA